jgi:TRAP-type mannitol/chloroaromatic compound transport system permease small subunit
MSLLDRIIERIGKLTSWLSLLLVLVIVVDVALRYLFSITTAASFELEWHLFALIFLLGSAYALQQDKHVRVDVFYTHYSPKKKALVNLIGTLVFLIPFCSIAFWESLSFVKSSFLLGETSPQPGGLPFRWLIKSSIPVGFFLLGLQGLSLIVRSLKILKYE